MKRSDLEHLLRAAGRVIGADQIIVVGSQAILATIPELMLPPEATMSVEADLIPLDGTEALADQIDGAIGEASEIVARLLHGPPGDRSQPGVSPDHSAACNRRSEASQAENAGSIPVIRSHSPW